MIRETISFDDILMVPRYSDLPSRRDTDISIKAFNRDFILPIMTSPMDTVTTSKMISFFSKKGLLNCLHRYFKSANEQYQYIKNNINYPHYSPDFFSVGSVPKYKDWIDKLYDDYGIRNFLIDMAHGDSKLCIDTVKYIKNFCGNTKVIAGNVATKSGFMRLQEAGADGIRCGVGSGSICSTRKMVGFGVPLLITIQDCYKVKDENTLLIADGGIKSSGDIAKCMAAGADLVMLGRMLAGTDLAGGQCYNKNKGIISEKTLNTVEAEYNEESQITYKEYYGMASSRAREGVMKHNSIEGVSGLIPYAGTTKNMLKNVEYNLRASLAYAGARTWKEFRRNVKFIKCSPGSFSETNTHVEDYR